MKIELNSIIKHQLKLLAERYSGVVHYEKQSLVLTKDNVTMKVVASDLKGTVTISFSLLPETTVSAEEHTLLEIARLFFMGKEKMIFQKKFNRQITESDLEADGLPLAYLKTIIKQADTYHDIGGNRILIEYFKGMLILTDDLGYYSANMMPIQ